MSRKYDWPDDYDGKADAEFILEKVMKRTRWSVTIRDELAERLVKIHYGKRLVETDKRRTNGRKNP